MDLGAAWAEIGVALSADFGGPYFAGQVLGETAPVMDAGGSIVTPGAPDNRDCMVQVNTSESLLRQLGYADGEVQFIIIQLTGALDTEARVRVAEGPQQGTWMVSQLARDSFGAYWAGKGKRAG